jgi:hypothetical protein
MKYCSILSAVDLKVQEKLQNKNTVIQNWRNSILNIYHSYTATLQGFLDTREEFQRPFDTDIIESYHLYFRRREK